jgi:hypothetical protein
LERERERERILGGCRNLWFLNIIVMSCVEYYALIEEEIVSVVKLVGKRALEEPRCRC